MPLILLLSIFCALPVVAGEWDITPRVTLTEEYTDNVTLLDQNTLSDFVTTITPGVTIRGDSAKLRLNVDYNMQNLLYVDNDDFDETNHQLQSDGLLTIIDNIFFVKGQASMSQQNNRAGGGFTPSNRSQTGNRSDVLFHEITPQVKHHLGNWADFTGDYGFARTERSGNNIGIGNSDEETLTLKLKSGTRLAKTPINIEFSDREATFDSGRENNVKRFTTDLSYVFSRKLRLTTEVGFDENQTNGRSNGRDGFRWKLGGTWTPSPRTTLKGHFGERGFGKTFDVSLLHRHRRLNFALAYKEQLQTQAQRQRELILVPLTDLGGQPVIDLNQSSNFLTPLNTPTVTEEVSLSKNLNVNLSYRLRRGSINGRFYQSERTFETSLQGEETRGASLGFQHNLRPRLSANLNLSWRESIRANDGDEELFNISPGFRYQLGPHTDLNISYQYTDSNGRRFNNIFAPSNSGGFIENALTANVIVHQ